MYALPTLLGFLLLLAGVFAFLHASPRTSPAPEPVTLHPVPTVPLEAELVHVREDGSEALQTVSLETPEERSAQLGAVLEALRGFLLGAGVWPPPLGAPRVFLVDGGAVLDFPLRGSPQVSAAQEARLLASVRRTLERQGVSQVTVLVGGRATPTFLGHLALADTLEN